MHKSYSSTLKTQTSLNGTPSHQTLTTQFKYNNFTYINNIAKYNNNTTNQLTADKKTPRALVGYSTVISDMENSDSELNDIELKSSPSLITLG